jgi:protein-S-isoprenylcysteine O-methyltransferase Ste14
MEPHAWQWATLAVWLGWFAVYFRGGAAFLRSARSRSVLARSRRGVAVELVIALSSLGILANGLLVALGRAAPGVAVRPVALQQLGFFLVLAGCASSLLIRFRYLGKHWLPEIAVSPSQPVVDSGPYGIVRHPLYSTNLALYTGTALAFPGWPALAGSLACLAAYALLAHTEDVFLERHLAGYVAYQQRVRHRFVPGVW